MVDEVQVETIGKDVRDHRVNKRRECLIEILSVKDEAIDSIVVSIQNGRAVVNQRHGVVERRLVIFELMSRFLLSFN